MPKKILRRSRNPRNNLRLRTLQSDEPSSFSSLAEAVLTTTTVLLHRGIIGFGLSPIATALDETSHDQHKGKCSCGDSHGEGNGVGVKAKFDGTSDLIGNYSRRGIA